MPSVASRVSTIKKNFLPYSRARVTRVAYSRVSTIKKIFYLTRARVTCVAYSRVSTIKKIFTLLARARASRGSLTRACRRLKNFFTLLARARHAVCCVARVDD